MSVIENDLNDDVYIGLEFPLKYRSTGFFKRTKTALEQTKHNIKNLLLTKKGERPGNPTFGSNLQTVLFEPQIEDLEDVVEEAIRSSISEWLSFVLIEDISTTMSDENMITVNITFGINTDPTSLEQIEISLGL